MLADPHIAVFQDQRRRLAGLGYRMTGSVADTEDMLQQVWLKWSSQPLADIDNPPRWLARAMTNLCLDHLRSARMRRETYIGAWLPDPLVADTATSAEQDWMRHEDVSIALMLVLDRLSPEMRAAFILRDAFDYDFAAIAGIVGRSPETCRQLVSRARRRLAGADLPDRVTLQDARPVAEAFWKASRRGDMQALVDLFARDVALHTDGGGKAPAAFNVLHGIRRAAGFFAGLARKGLLRDSPPAPVLRRINGAPGFVTIEQGGILQTTTFDIRNGRIAAIWITRNPDKLAHLRGLGWDG